MASKLLLVVPCYNEQEILELTNERLNEYFDELESKKVISCDSQICYVNDGSKDRTWEIIEKFSTESSRVLGVKLSKNFGHQNALMAGLLSFADQYECYISIDADLQDEVSAIESMIHHFKQGNEVVYGVKNDRSTDTFFKRFTAESFYKLMGEMGVPVVFNHADFRLISNRVLRELSQYREYNMYLRGIIPNIGFKSEKVYYKRLEREIGESKYPINKMLGLAWKGITSFSIVPMRLVLWFGIFNFFVAILIGLYVIWSKFTMHTVVSGWTSIVLPMAFFSGSNMIAIGVIGEYIGKVYEEVKGRPRFIVEKIIK